MKIILQYKDVDWIPRTREILPGIEAHGFYVKMKKTGKIPEEGYGLWVPVTSVSSNRDTDTVIVNLLGGNIFFAEKINEDEETIPITMSDLKKMYSCTLCEIHDLIQNDIELLREFCSGIDTFKCISPILEEMIELSSVAQDAAERMEERLLKYKEAIEALGYTRNE